MQPPFDGLPANASNPSYDGSTSVAAFHLATECIQQLSPSWNESHVDWNRKNPTSATAKMDGFVYNAAVYAMNPPPGEATIYDTTGIRAMGYYDGSDLNYCYFHGIKFRDVGSVVLACAGSNAPKPYVPLWQPRPKAMPIQLAQTLPTQHH